MTDLQTLLLFVIAIELALQLLVTRRREVNVYNVHNSEFYGKMDEDDEEEERDPADYWKHPPSDN